MQLRVQHWARTWHSTSEFIIGRTHRFPTDLAWTWMADSSCSPFASWWMVGSRLCIAKIARCTYFIRDFASTGIDTVVGVLDSQPGRTLQQPIAWHVLGASSHCFRDHLWFDHRRGSRT